MTGRFTQANAAGHHRMKCLIREILAHLIHDLRGEIGARIKHGQNHATDKKVGVEVLAHELNGLPQAAQPLQRQVLALDGHNNSVLRSRECVDGKQAQARRTVDQKVVVARQHGLHRLTQEMLACQDGHHLDLCARQGRGAGSKIQTRLTGRDDNVGQRDTPDQDVIKRLGKIAASNAETARSVSLRVGIHDQHFAPGGRQVCAQVDGSGGFSHPAFLVSESVDTRHEGLEDSAKRRPPRQSIGGT